MGRWHADAVRRLGRRVALIIEPNETAGTSLARRHPGARAITTFDARLIVEHASIAHVCSPVSTHAPIVAALVRAGVHVIVEKPFTPTAAETEELVSLAEGTHVLVCPVHQFLFQDGVRRLRAWLPTLGKIRRVEFSACSAGAKGPDGASQDDLVAEILPHPLSLVSQLLDTPVGRLDWVVVHPSPGELRAVAVAGDGVVDVAISANGRPTENMLRVVGDFGSATADLYHGYAIRSGATVSRWMKVTYPFVGAGRTLQTAAVNLARRTINREPAYPGLRALVRAFYEAVERGAPSPIEPAAIIDVAAARDLILDRIVAR